MAFHFMCPQGHLLQGERQQMGQPSQCPICGVVFLIPTITQAESPTSHTTSGQEEPKTGEVKPSEQELPVAEQKQTDQQKPAKEVQQQPASAEKRQTPAAESQQHQPAAPAAKKNQPTAAEQQEVESEEPTEAFDPYHKWFGIDVDIGEPKDQPPNLYRLLGINLFESDIDVITAAVKKRILDIRNNQTGKDAAQAQKIRNEVSAARVCLLDTNKKSQYDEQLRQASQSKLASESSNEGSTQPLESSAPTGKQTSEQKTAALDTKQEPGSAKQPSAQAAKKQPADVATGQQKKLKTPIEDSRKQTPAAKKNQPTTAEQQEVVSEQQTEAFDPYHKWLGIPPKDQPPNHYRLLGIELFESDSDAITAGADRGMLDIRKKQTGKRSDFALKIRGEISAARICLLDPEKRAKYDEQLRQATQSKLAPESSNQGSTAASQVPQPPPVPPEFGGQASSSTATGPPPVQRHKVAGTTKATATSSEPSKQPASAYPDLSGLAADQEALNTTRVSTSSASPVLMPNPLVHVQCPEGHLLETPMEMMGQRVMCPHCQRPFTLHHTDTVEYKRDRQAIQTRRTARFGRNALAWSIVAAVALASGLVVLVIYLIK